MSFAFASYKVTHKAVTGGNRTVTEGHATLRPNEENKYTEDVFSVIVDMIAADHGVPTSAVAITSFNVLPELVD